METSLAIISLGKQGVCCFTLVEVLHLYECLNLSLFWCCIILTSESKAKICQVKYTCI